MTIRKAKQEAWFSVGPTVQPTPRGGGGSGHIAAWPGCGG